MALTLTKSGISQANTINAWHVTQSIDAFSGLAAYNITLSGSLKITGSTDITGSVTIKGTLNATSSHAITSSYLYPPSDSLSAEYIPSGSIMGIVTPLKLIAGFATIPSSSQFVSVTLNNLNAKILGVNCFISVGVSSSYSTSSMNDYPFVHSLTGPSLTFRRQNTGSTDINFYFTIMHI